jgi:hypothetical protein
MEFVNVVYDKQMLKLQKPHNRLHRKLFRCNHKYTHVITIEDLLSGVIIS